MEFNDEGKATDSPPATDDLQTQQVEKVVQEETVVETKTTNVVIHSENSRMETTQISSESVEFIDSTPAILLLTTDTETGASEDSVATDLIVDTDMSTITSSEHKTEIVTSGTSLPEATTDTQITNSDILTEKVLNEEQHQPEAGDIEATKTKNGETLLVTSTEQIESKIDTTTEVEAKIETSELPSKTEPSGAESQITISANLYQTILNDATTTEVNEPKLEAVLSENIFETLPKADLPASEPQLQIPEVECKDIISEHESTSELKEHHIEETTTGLGDPVETQSVNPKTEEETVEEAVTISSVVPNVKEEPKGGHAEIQEGSLKTQLHEIINEIDLEVYKEEEAIFHHTWQPKGRYEIQKTEIKYEDVVPCELPDVTLTEQAKMENSSTENTTTGSSNQGVTNNLDQEEDEREKEEISKITMKVLKHAQINGDVISPLEIPIGIPLLARVLPKENDENGPKEKIPLERLFTPATDMNDFMIPHKKKAYASSCFYRPEHPTIDDQVELAHKISVSLIDEENKQSRGQSMYMKRKNRSAKWIHQAFQNDGEEEEPHQPSKEKPPLKLLLNPKGIQDYSTVETHYEELMTSEQTKEQINSMELGKEIITNLQSPTGKGAALFAKRKKRMDQFIVDETTVQQQSNSFEESKSTAISSSSTKMETSVSSQNVQMTSANMEPSVTSSSSQQQLQGDRQTEGGTIYTAEVKVLQNAPVPSPPVLEFPITQHSILDDFSISKEEEKRRSFNLAAKGWGTYTNFYTPVHLGAR